MAIIDQQSFQGIEESCSWKFNWKPVESSFSNVCSNHFISSRPSKLYETCNPDFALGY